MSRIQNTFARLQAAGRQALIPYITAGDPHPDKTVELMHALVRGGADIIELGVPFTDPMADGPVIQAAAERALKFGTSLRQVMEMVAQFRTQDQDTPVVLMGYANPIEAMTYPVFAATAKKAGVDGVLTVDLPPEEAAGRLDVLKEYGLDPIFLIAPTTPASRLEQVAKLAQGYVYYVSLKGVTGAASLDVASVENKLLQLRQYLSLPIGVGFGIRDAESARAIAKVADAVIVGSRLVQELAAGGDDLNDRLVALLAGMRAAIDTARV